MTSGRILRTRIALSITAAAALALTGCAAELPEPDPTRTVEVEASPSADAVDATPTPTSDPTTEILLRSTGFEIHDENGATTFAYVWSDEGDDAVAALEELFGQPAQVSTRAGDGAHFPDYTLYDWGAFAFADEQNLEGPREEYPISSYVEVWGPGIGATTFTTVDGLAVGMTEQAVKERLPLKVWEDVPEGPTYLFDVDDRSRIPDGSGGSWVAAIADPESDTIVTLRAPLYDSGL